MRLFQETEIIAAWRDVAPDPWQREFTHFTLAEDLLHRRIVNLLPAVIVEYRASVVLTPTKWRFTIVSNVQPKIALLLFVMTDPPKPAGLPRG